MSLLEHFGKLVIVKSFSAPLRCKSFLKLTSSKTHNFLPQKPGSHPFEMYSSRKIMPLCLDALVQIVKLLLRYLETMRKFPFPIGEAN